jgi:predicted HNH restriction endonuclease
MKKKPTTPRSKVRNALRQVFLRSRERYAAGKAANWTCEICGKKQSKAKGKEVRVEIHHRGVISNWDEVLAAVYEKLLVSPDKLQCLCRDCHNKLHGETR